MRFDPESNCFNRYFINTGNPTLLSNIEEKVKQFKEEFKDDPEALQEVHNLFKKSIKDIKELEGGEKDEEDKDDKEKVKSVEEVDLGYLDIEQVNIYNEERLSQLISKTDVCVNLVGILYESGKKKHI